MMAFSRADRSVLAEWWFTVDRALLGAVLGMLAVGVLVSLAASPAVAVKKGFSPFHFVERHMVFAIMGATLVFAVSLLDERAIRRLALVVFVAAVAAMVAVLGWGEEINGARRWLRVVGFSLQPSELAKPAFVVLSAWALAQAGLRRDVPALPIALGLYASVAVILVQQPDVGQTVLISLIWGMMFVLAGQSLLWSALLALGGAAGLVSAYLTLGYVRLRVNRFLNPVPGDHSQTDRALQSFSEGGFFGRGPGEGTIKTILPDAHTDFILAVIAEEYGIILCLLLLAAYAYLVFRPISRVAGHPDPFVRLAVTGLCFSVGAQALINMAVNVGLLPAKGMTLPFISAGGSSLLSVALTMGIVLALTRRRPGTQGVLISPFAPSESLKVVGRPDL